MAQIVNTSHWAVNELTHEVQIWFLHLLQIKLIVYAFCRDKYNFDVHNS